MTLFVDCSDSEFSVVQPNYKKDEYSLIEDEAQLFKEHFANESKCNFRHQVLSFLQSTLQQHSLIHQNLAMESFYFVPSGRKS